MGIFRTILSDFRAARERDPSARGWTGSLAICLCYPGFKAVVAHRFLHGLQRLPGMKLPSRVLSQSVRFFTGTEIHPAATIGPGFFIDHAHGVVIGETTIVGRNVTIFQGVTLGGTGKETGKRHPTVGDNVVIGAGAKILGNITIGLNARVGAGSVVVRDVPEGCTVVGVPAVIVRRAGRKLEPPTLDHADMPNPLVDRIAGLRREVGAMRAELDRAEETLREAGLVTNPDAEELGAGI